MRVRIDLQLVAAHGNDAFDKRLLRIAVDHHNIAVLRCVKSARQNQAVFMHQGIHHGLAVHTDDAEEKREHHDDTNQGKHRRLHPVIQRRHIYAGIGLGFGYMQREHWNVPSPGQTCNYCIIIAQLSA